MPDPATRGAPAWVSTAPLGDARWRLVCIARRGVGMTIAAGLFWLAMAGVAAFAGLDPSRLAVCLAIGGVLVYPAGYVLNRLLGGDLTAKGSAFRGLVGAITIGQSLGAPVVVALLVRDVQLVAFALAVMLGAHFLPYGWLYRAPAYYALGIGGAVIAAGVQAIAPVHANLLVAASMAVLYAAASLATLRLNAREGVARG